MNKNKWYVELMLMAAMVVLAACGPISASAQEAPPTAEQIDPGFETQESTFSEVDASGAAVGTVVQEVKEQSGIPVAGWLGCVVSLPDGSQYDDYLVLSPEGTGEMGLSGAAPEIEEAIAALRDHPEPGKYAHFWGVVTCDVMDYNGCQLVVTRIRSGATDTQPEPVIAWEGILQASTFNSGDSTVFVLAAEFPMWFSIHSNDAAILDQLLTLRQTDSLVRVWGELITGVPDVNGSRIQVSRIEVVKQGNNVVSVSQQAHQPVPGWLEYCSPHYGYCIQYPEVAELGESGIHGVPTEEIPSNMDLDSYIAQLEETYGKDICVQVRTELAYLYISAPGNAQFKYAICGRTGVGAGEMVDKSEEVTLMGKTYVANGFEVNSGGETTNLYNETLVFTLEDGTRIEYGTLPRSDATFEDYEMKGKPIIFQILETYSVVE